MYEIELKKGLFTGDIRSQVALPPSESASKLSMSPYDLYDLVLVLVYYKLILFHVDQITTFWIFAYVWDL